MKGWYSVEDIPQTILERPRGPVFFLGGPDTGKTTLFKKTAALFLGAGHKVGLIDADVGQSTIGPPTTIGMKIAEGGLPDLFRAQELYFVGNTSPVGHLLESCAGSRLMVDGARGAGAEAIFFDSSGLIQPPYGQVLKYHKIELLRPQYVVALEKGDELAPIISWLSRCRDIELFRARPSAEVRPKSTAERTKRRQEQYRRYFQEASPKSFSIKELCLYPPGFLSGKTDPAGLLVGLQDETWRTVAIGIIESINQDTVDIYAPYQPQVSVCSLLAGHIKVDRSGIETGRVSPRSFLT